MPESSSFLLNIDSSSFKVMLPLITTTGFLDGLNPCAFAVLLFFIAYLFTIRKTRASIWKMGLVYISAIYLVYLGIGVGGVRGGFPGGTGIIRAL